MHTNCASFGLITEGIDDVWSGTNEDQSGIFDLLGKRSILRKKAVARVNHRDAMSECDLDNLILCKLHRSIK